MLVTNVVWLAISDVYIQSVENHMENEVNKYARRATTTHC
jgi:hypothetical protein